MIQNFKSSEAQIYFFLLFNRMFSPTVRAGVISVDCDLTVDLNSHAVRREVLRQCLCSATVMRFL